MSSPREKPATDTEVLSFIGAVFPDAPHLAILAFDEGHVLRTATELLRDLRLENNRLKAESSLSTLEGQIRELVTHFQGMLAVAKASMEVERMARNSSGTNGFVAWEAQAAAYERIVEKLSALLRSRETIPQPQGDGEASS